MQLLLVIESVESITLQYHDLQRIAKRVSFDVLKVRIMDSRLQSFVEQAPGPITETADLIVYKTAFSFVVFQILACDWRLPLSMIKCQ